jgi:DivIVA domain-containing protein
MGVDNTSLDRIRNATFPSSRRGYDKQEVEKFLARLADWLETGGGDESRSETVKRELQRVGERTGAILSQAEDSAQQIISEAEETARGTRAEADSYSETTRADADKSAQQTHDEAHAEARETIADAQAQARRIVAEGTQRRQDIESVIADLVCRRDEVLEDTEQLGGKLAAAVETHRPLTGADPFETPDELDPERRVAAEVDQGRAATGVDDAELADDIAEADLEPEGEPGAGLEDETGEQAEPEPDEPEQPKAEEPPAKEPAAKKPKKTRSTASKGTRRRGVKA